MTLTSLQSLDVGIEKGEKGILDLSPDLSRPSAMDLLFHRVDWISMDMNKKQCNLKKDLLMLERN